MAIFKRKKKKDGRPDSAQSTSVGSLPASMASSNNEVEERNPANSDDESNVLQPSTNDANMETNNLEVIIDNSTEKDSSIKDATSIKAVSKDSSASLKAFSSDDSSSLLVPSKDGSGSEKDTSKEIASVAGSISAKASASAETEKARSRKFILNRSSKSTSDSEDRNIVVAKKKSKSGAEDRKIMAKKESNDSNAGKEVNYDVSPTPLYKFIEGKEWNEALKRCNDTPEEAKVWVYRLEENQSNEENTVQGTEKPNIRWRMLPIHVAVIFNAPIKLITGLYEANPDGIELPDDRKMLPLHLACRVVSNVNVAQFFIFKSQSSLHATDYKGRTPLDILKQYRDSANGTDEANDKKANKNREALTRLIEEKIRSNEKKEIASKSSARSKKLQRAEPTESSTEPTAELDYDEYPTVLIQLIEKKMWEQAITRCVEVPQEASTWMCRLQEIKNKRDEKNDVRWKILPIHSAIVLHAPVEVIEALVEAYPQGLRKGDDRRMLPLHMAFRLGSSPETAAVLVDAYPTALRKKDSRGHTPLHILKAYRRKYMKEHESGKKKSTTEMDSNRKKLIKFYLGGRRYGMVDEDSGDRLRKYDSDSNSDDDDSSDDDSYCESDAEEGLFYTDMFSDIGKLTYRGISSFPIIMRDTLACRGTSFDLGS
mmetsp:Transcript_30268/g.35222  ORF Transcript_30268/g.35222 Transcript_30268/m.35222 type:complete len:655 (-) Transcript_30268:295-2259(-)